MTLLAPTMEAFFTERLAGQRHASANTIASYRDSLRLLLVFVQRQSGTPPSRLDLGDLDAPLIGAFLDHLERERGVSVRTRNLRLAAVRSLFRFAALRHPEHGAVIQRVLAIPQKRCELNEVSFLNPDEVAAILAAPDQSTRIGRRDHALLVLAVQTGLRVSELLALRRQDLDIGAGAQVTCQGKGRKQRSTPLTGATAKVMKAWLREVPSSLEAPVFAGPRGQPLGRDAIRRLVTRHCCVAQDKCPSLGSKHVTPHVLRHTCAMSLLQAGVDLSTIALWLGHASIETTQIYLHADLTLKERALERTNQTTANGTLHRYRASDSLLEFLDTL